MTLLKRATTPVLVDHEPWPLCRSARARVAGSIKASSGGLERRDEWLRQRLGADSLVERDQ
jgi:hypothetical protein